jgi:hypothetical protein
VKRTRRLAWFAVGILGVYSIFLAQGVYAYSQERGARETFPFFIWDLFSRVPQPDQVSYGIRLTEMDGTRLDPVYYEETTLPTHQSSAAQAMIGTIGSAYESGDAERVDHYRTIWESRYLQPLASAQYELVRREYDVEERHDCDCYRREVVLAEFVMGRS